MKRADLYRKNLINKILTEGRQDNNRLNLTLSGGYGTYS